MRTSSKWGKIRLPSIIWPWSSRLITPQNDRHLNQGVLHLYFKFGDSSLNGWWVIMQTSKWLIHTQTHRLTDTQTGAMTIPEGQNWPRVKMVIRMATYTQHKFKCIHYGKIILITLMLSATLIGHWGPEKGRWNTFDLPLEFQNPYKNDLKSALNNLPD